MPIEMIQYGRVTWVNIVRATPDDVEFLREDYPHFHPLDLEDLLSRIERPKIDEYDDYLFTVMQFPAWDAKLDVSRPCEVDMFVGIGYLVTVHDGTLKSIETLFRRCVAEERAREQYMKQGASRLFYTVMDQLVDQIFPLLNRVDGKIRTIEEDIFSGNPKRLIQQIAYIRRENITLRRMVRPQLEILESLEKMDRPYIRDELDIYFGDIRDHLIKAADLISDHKEIIEGLADTANTLANYRTNEIVKILTLISVLITPLTFITSVYGMNISLPLQEHPATFVGLVVGMLCITGTMIGYFKLQGWL
jgi:magnesium transporter